MNTYVIGVDIGGTNLRIGAVDEQGNLTAFQKQPIGVICQTGNVLEGLRGFLQSYIADNRLGEVAAIAMGFPATMDKQRTRVLNAPNLKGIDNVEIKQTLTDALGIPVFLEKDVAMLFYHDAAQHSLPLDGIIIGCYVGTGLGNVISIDGKLIAGSHGVACELGHIPIPGNTRPCGCGNLGCMETVASGWALQELVKDRHISQAFSRMDEEMMQFVDSIACAIAAEINILDPDAIVLGGGVLAMEHFPIKLLEERLHFHARKPLPAEDLKIYYSNDTGKNGVLGAAFFARKCLKERSV